MARLFCGPDRSEWVPIAFTTPKATMKTLLEAIRRDNPDVVFRCLGDDYKRTHGGTETVGFSVAWDRLKAETPGLHLAGYAVIPEPSVRVDGKVLYRLDVEGHPIEIELARQHFYEVGDQSWPVPDLARYAKIRNLQPDQNDAERALIDLALPFSPGRKSVSLEQIERAGIGSEWKVAALRVPEAGK